ncbi:thiamin pyrophosphokinase 1 [Folsomia candida]|uniref:thiamin pyrophosphokinase 1 n=1 Tax=Folsomia candida TaxID=158441 RepID=UPI000B90996D|nr:thiamin pyrophosphokinase 1 [Folsomia candida]
MSEINLTKWDVSEIFKNQNSLILLNQPVLNESFFVELWNKAKLRILVDGGGNRWDKIKTTFPDISYPHIVSGDFDSIRPHVLEQFKQQNEIRIIETLNQDETDFTKALRILQEELSSLPQTQVAQVVAYCESSGRFDQIMANIETLFHAVTIAPSVQLFLMGSTSITWLLPPGLHQIQFGDVVVPYCSLIPVGSPCSSITTTGLRWNLTNGKLEFGYLVSTSNEIAAENVDRVVTVNNSEPILWSMEFGSPTDS